MFKPMGGPTLQFTRSKVRMPSCPKNTRVWPDQKESIRSEDSVHAELERFAGVGQEDQRGSVNVRLVLRG